MAVWFGTAASRALDDAKRTRREREATERAMTGFLATLSPEQRESALNHVGPENIGSTEYGKVKP